MNDLDQETARVNHKMAWMTWRDSYAAEAPLRIHSKGTGEGHGLGGPDFAPEFMAYLRDGGVCFCEPREVNGYMVFRHSCDKRLRPPSAVTGEKFHARRIKRALRQLRAISFEEWEVVNARLVRHLDWAQTVESVNEYRLRRGTEEASPRDIYILLFAGLSKISESYGWPGR